MLDGVDGGVVRIVVDAMSDVEGVHLHDCLILKVCILRVKYRWVPYPMPYPMAGPDKMPMQMPPAPAKAMAAAAGQDSKVL